MLTRRGANEKLGRKSAAYIGTVSRTLVPCIAYRQRVVAAAVAAAENAHPGVAAELAAAAYSMVASAISAEILDPLISISNISYNLYE